MKTATKKTAAKKTAKKTVKSGPDLKAILSDAKTALAAVKAGKKPDTKGAAIVGMVMDGADVGAIAKKVKTTEASVYWHRSRLHKLGAKLPAAAAA